MHQKTSFLHGESENFLRRDTALSPDSFLMGKGHPSPYPTLKCPHYNYILATPLAQCTEHVIVDVRMRRPTPTQASVSTGQAGVFKSATF